MPRHCRPGVTYPNPSVHRGVWTVYGKVNNDSAPVVLAGTGFSVAYTATGIITITFTNKATTLVDFQAKAVDGKAEIHTDYSADDGTIKVATYNNDGTTAADKDFYFSATFSDASASP